MEFSQTIAARHSCRSFLDTSVDAATVTSLVETAQQSPSWGNTQPWRVWVAGGQVAQSIRRELAQEVLSGKEPYPDIPMPLNPSNEGFKARYAEVGKALFAFLGIGQDDEEKRKAHIRNNCNAFGASVLVYLTVPAGQTPYAVLDIGAFAHAFCMAAVDKGLATCIQAILARYPDVVRRHLPIPEDESIVVGIALGHADITTQINQFRSSREPLEKVLSLTGF